MTRIEKGRHVPAEDSYRIMIVGGDESHMKDLKHYLQKAGQETKDHVDVILTEVFLEAGNVFELIRLVKKDPLHKDVPVLLLADEPSKLGKMCVDNVAQAAETLGAYNLIHMSKFDLHFLLNEIKKILLELGLPKREAHPEGAY